MTAPSTFTVTGTFTNANGSVAAGTVAFQPAVNRFDNNGNVIDAKIVTVTLDGSGTLGAGVILVQCTQGYNVTVSLTGHAVAKSTIAGTTNVNITPSNPGTIVLTGVWYTSDGATGAGTINITQTSTGTSFSSALGATGSIGASGGGVIVPNDAAGYDIVENVTGAVGAPSYHCSGTGNVNLGAILKVVAMPMVSLGSITKVSRNHGKKRRKIGGTTALKAAQLHQTKQRALKRTKAKKAKKAKKHKKAAAPLPGYGPGGT